MITVKELRVLFPNPRATIDGNGEQGSVAYCVGGALCQFFARADNLHPFLLDQNFPSPNFLATVLLNVNPNLSEDQAHYFSGSITRLNDRNEFGVAWSLLNQALTYGVEIEIELRKAS